MKKRRLLTCLVLIICAIFALSGCAMNKYIVDVSFRATSEGTVATYTYSDGTQKTQLIRDGKDGKDGQDVTAQSAYELWLEKNGKEDTAANYNAFLSTLDLQLPSDHSASVQSALGSVATLYCEYVYKDSSSASSILGGSKTQYALAVSCGSAFVYEMDEDADGYTYLVTNSHVIYCEKADRTANGGYYPRSIHCFLYGSYNPKTAYGATNQIDSNYGFTLYEYNPLSVECELVGICISADLAVVRTKTAELKAVNPDIKEVTAAEDYYVGQEVFTVGNTDMEGLTATQGIISVDDEDITLEIGGKQRSYRALRFDAFIYEGNSGGALFNSRGELVGVTFAGSPEFDNVNYAIPVDIYEVVVPNLIDNYNGSAVSYAKKPTLGVTVSSESAKFVYDAQKGYGKIQEVVVVKSVELRSIASKMGLRQDDQILAITIGDVRTDITRSFKISDALYRLRAGSTISAEVLRNGETRTLGYVVSANDLPAID